MARHRSQQMRIAQPLDRAQGDAVAHGGLRQVRQGPRIHDEIDRFEAFGFAQLLERLERDIAKHRQRLGAHLIVAVVARDRRQRCRRHQLRHRRLAHARIVIAAGDRRDGVALGERQLLDKGEADGRIGMFVAGLGAEPVEQRHMSLQPGLSMASL
jgi:hypothetical protein